jgi:hypothetical protein
MRRIIRDAARTVLPSDPLARELVVILAVKVLVLIALWAAFFSGPEPADEPGAVAERILQTPQN